MVSFKLKLNQHWRKYELQYKINASEKPFNKLFCDASLKWKVIVYVVNTLF